MDYFIFFISILVHECSHIIWGILFGYKIKNFYFLPFGTYIEFKEQERKKNQIVKNIIIYFAGPIFNFFISYIFLNYPIKYSEKIIYTNIILGIFNLLPIVPLDGGKIIKEIFKIFLDNKKSNIYSYRISKIFLCLLTFLYSLFIVKFQNISLIIVLFYLWYIDYKEEKKIHTLIRAYNVIEKTNF